MSKITIYDYCGKPTTFEVNLEEVRSIRIMVLSGDEIADIEYKDGTFCSHDSSTERELNFFDGEYYAFHEHGINFLEDEKWISTHDSYERLR